MCHLPTNERIGFKDALKLANVAANNLRISIPGDDPWVVKKTRTILYGRKRASNATNTHIAVVTPFCYIQGDLSTVGLPWC